MVSITILSACSKTGAFGNGSGSATARRKGVPRIPANFLVDFVFAILNFDIGLAKIFRLNSKFPPEKALPSTLKSNTQLLFVK